ncbi:MAG: hypothetical protein Q7K41_01765 [Dehalococcoidales bacterium]|nr:hypothetical protein [Dehalococcoidales bacterium]
MQKRGVRVVLASEYPQVRHLLSEVIEQENGVDIVGQAQDARQALTLTRNLRPDIAVIDSHLPHHAGLNNNPLSRMYGLDTAQNISEEMPNTRVVLLSNLQAGSLSEKNMIVDSITIFSREKTGVNIPITFRELYHETSPLSAPFFADIGVKEEAGLQQKTSISDKLVFFGALGFASGWLITLTIFLAPVGVPIAILGAATAALGLLGKLTASIWRDKTKSSAKKW